MQAAVEKIYKHFSVENVIKRIREVKIMSTLSMNKYQRTLLPYLSKNLISTKPEKIKDKMWHKAALDYD